MQVQYLPLQLQPGLRTINQEPFLYVDSWKSHCLVPEPPLADRGSLMHQLAGSRLLLNMRHEFSCKHDCQDEEAGTFAVLSKKIFH